MYLCDVMLDTNQVVFKNGTRKFSADKIISFLIDNCNYHITKHNEGKILISNSNHSIFKELFDVISNPSNQTYFDINNNKLSDTYARKILTDNCYILLKNKATITIDYISKSDLAYFSKSVRG